MPFPYKVHGLFGVKELGDARLPLELPFPPVPQGAVPETQEDTAHDGGLFCGLHFA